MIEYRIEYKIEYGRDYYAGHIRRTEGPSGGRIEVGMVIIILQADLGLEIPRTILI